MFFNSADRAFRPGYLLNSVILENRTKTYIYYSIPTQSRLHVLAP